MNIDRASNRVFKFQFISELNEYLEKCSGEVTAFAAIGVEYLLVAITGYHKENP